MQTKWNLEKYFYTGLDDPKLKSDIEKVIPEVQKFVDTYKGNISTISTSAELLKFYNESEELDKNLQGPGHYLFYRYAQDTQNTDIQKALGEIEVLGVQVGEMLLFVTQEFKQIGEKRLREFSNDTILLSHRNAIIEHANSLKYTLEEKEEWILNKKSRTLGILGMHDELRNSFLFPMEIDGKIKELPEEELRSYARDVDREVRKKASESMQGIYLTKQNQLTFGNLYGGIVKNWTSSMEIRGYNEVMSKRNISEMMDDEVVNMLMKKVQDNAHLYQRFLTAKKKLLRYENLYGYDVLAPIGSIDREYSFEQAYEIHQGIMQDFDDEFAQYSSDMLESGRIDVFPEAGKRGGAFASYSKGLESFVLLNFTGKIDDIFTLTHEIGHAIHGHLSQGQPECVYDSPLSLAETASIFNEILLTKKISADLKVEEKAQMLNQQLTDIFGTISRQIMYVSFEKEVHEKILSGEELTYKDLNILWSNHSKKLSGDVVTSQLEDDQNYVWSVIPHIFSTPFYCYAYSFGMILSFSLANMYEEEGDIFVPKYKKILQAGGSRRPKDLLADIDIDIASESFYDNAFSQIEMIVSEFESLCD